MMSNLVQQESITLLKTDLVTMYDEYIDLGEMTKADAQTYRPINKGFRPMEHD